MKPFIKPSERQIILWIERNIPNFKIRSSSKHGEIYNIPNPSDINGKNKLGISPSKGWVLDFRPHYSKYNGSFLGFVSKYRNCSFHEAISEVCGDTSDAKALIEYSINSLQRKREDEYDPVEEDKIELPIGLLKITNKSKPKAWKLATNYLLNRQISLAEAELHDVRYGPTTICFPYYEYGSIVYWQSRHLINKEFIFPKSTATSQTVEEFLHGFDQIEPGEIIIPVESIFNELVIGTGATSTGGAALKQNQFRKIKTLFPRKIILAPDLDGAGISSLRYNYELLSPYFAPKLFYCLPPKNMLNLDKEENDWNDVAKNINRLENPTFIKDYILENAKPLKLSILMRLMTKRF